MVHFVLIHQNPK